MGTRLPVLKDGKFLSSTKTALGNVKGTARETLTNLKDPMGVVSDTLTPNLHVANANIPGVSSNARDILTQQVELAEDGRMGDLDPRKHEPNIPLVNIPYIEGL